MCAVSVCVILTVQTVCCRAAHWVASWKYHVLRRKAFRTAKVQRMFETYFVVRVYWFAADNFTPMHALKLREIRGRYDIEIRIDEAILLPA